MPSSVPLVAGVDSSTTATKVVVRNAITGELVREGRAEHPPGTEVPPEAWWDAYRQATAGGLLDGVAALAIGAQQHGLITVDGAGEVVRPALLWNDVRSAGAAADLVSELGGPQAWAEAVGSVPVASFTVTKLRWLAAHEPDNADRVEQVLLPHDWLTWRLLDRAEPPTTDRGDASGTGYWSPATGRYREDLLTLAFGRSVGVPRVCAPEQSAGWTRDGMLVAAGTGDNMAAALGCFIGPGDVVVSIGTSGTVFGVAERPTADPTGFVAGFADATGRYLPLVCTLNAARVLRAAATMLDVDLARLDDLALSAPAGADGLVLLPYLEGERTPNRPDARGMVAGMTPANATPANLARAAVEGLLCGLADGLDMLRVNGVRVDRVMLVGGGSRSRAVQQIAPGVLGAPVATLPPGEYVADGAARQAAWALSGDPEPPEWSITTVGQPIEAAPEKVVREQYAAVRDATA